MYSRSSLVVFVAAAIAPRVASQCPAGHDNKASDSATQCGADAATCSTNTCCTVNSGTCHAVGVVCGSGKYEDPSKKWASAGSTQTEKVANCCSAPATCADVTCPAGHEHNFSPPSSQTCNGLVASCQGCCKATTGKCASQASTICDSGTFKDPAKNGNIAGDATAAKTNCCTAQATCADVTCPAGSEQFSPPSSQKCNGLVASCYVGCCKPTTGTCFLEASNICASGFYKDPLKYGNTAGDATAKKTTCCTAKATCNDFWALANPTASGALKKTPLSVAVVGATAAIISLM